MLRLQTITSASNPLLKEVRRAVSRNERTEDGLCLAEGFHLLDEALRSGCELPVVFAAESALRAVEERLAGAAAGRILVLPDALFQTVASTETSQGVLALLPLPAWSADDVFPASGALVVVLDGLQDPGNAGAIVRAAEAFGATGVIFTKGTASPYHPKTLRATAGSLFRVPFLAGLDTAAARRLLLERQVAVYAAMPFTGSQKLAGATDFVRACALVAGNEGRGVGKELRGIAEEVAIPTTGVESLNSSVAAAILLYEARRQRQSAGARLR